MFFRPPMQPIVSSNLSAVGYDPTTETLFVDFRNGGRYSYASVPSYRFRGLMTASSHGSYFHEHIRNSYSATRL